MIALTVALPPPCVCEHGVHDLVHVTSLMAVGSHVRQHSPQDLVQSGGSFVQEDARLGQEVVQVSVGAHFLLEVHWLDILTGARDKKDTANHPIVTSSHIYTPPPPSTPIYLSKLHHTGSVWKWNPRKNYDFQSFELTRRSPLTFLVVFRSPKP